MTFSAHARARFEERIAISKAEFASRFATQAVLERVEPDGPRHYVIYLPEHREFFCVVMERDLVITLMPLIWRLKQVSDAVLEEARQSATGDQTTRQVKQTLLGKVSCMLRWQDGKDPSTTHIGSSAFSPDGSYDRERLGREVEAAKAKHRVSDTVPVSVRARLGGAWKAISL